jgi:hypothetical protein
MRLSEAMMLGSATCVMVPGDINSCALGAACNAIGMRKHAAILDVLLALKEPLGARLAVRPISGFDRVPALMAVWPWLSDSHHGRVNGLYLVCDRRLGPVNYGTLIAQRFDDEVCSGRMTFEQLVDLVRAAEPECGDCCRFACVCGAISTDSTAMQVQEAATCV